MYIKKTDVDYVRHSVEEVARIDAIILEKYTGDNTDEVGAECGRTRRQIWSAVSRLRRKGFDLPKTTRVYKEDTERINHVGTKQVKKNGKWVTIYKHALMSEKERVRIMMFVKDHYKEMSGKEMAKATGVSSRTISEYISKLKDYQSIKDKRKEASAERKREASKIYQQQKLILQRQHKRQEKNDSQWQARQVHHVYDTKVQVTEGMKSVRLDSKTVIITRNPEKAIAFYNSLKH